MLDYAKCRKTRIRYFLSIISEPLCYVALRTLGGIPCLYMASDRVSTETTESYNRKYTNRAMAADREKDLEPVEDVIVSVSHDAYGCLNHSPLRSLVDNLMASNGWEIRRNLKHSTRSGVTCSSRL